MQLAYLSSVNKEWQYQGHQRLWKLHLSRDSVAKAEHGAREDERVTKVRKQLGVQH